jgi:LacI family transcriptional regulator
MKGVSIYSVADVAKVSIATVSRVINNDPGVSLKTVERVRQAIAQTGYIPTPVSGRKGRRSRPRKPIRKMQIALISRVSSVQIKTPVYSSVMHGIEDELSTLNFNLIVRSLPVIEPWAAIPKKIDGAILFQVNDDDPMMINALRNLSCVRVMGPALETDFFDLVTYDNAAVGRLAAEHLLNLGHRRLSYVGSLDPNNNNRGIHFKAAVMAAGAEFFEIKKCSDHLMLEDGSHQLPNMKALGAVCEQLVAMPKRPTAIFVYADILVMGLYNIMPHYGIKPGIDIILVGTNNDRVYLEPLFPRPATVNIHADQVGRKAVERLLWRLDNPKEPFKKIELQPELIQ